MKKQQIFALFLATCLLSSEIPIVHASQEETPKQENPSNEEPSTEEGETLKQEDPSNEEPSTEEGETPKQEDPSNEEPSTEEGETPKQEDPSNEEPSTEEGETPKQEDPSNEEPSTEEGETPKQEDPSNEKPSTEEGETPKQENPSNEEPSTEEEETPKQEDPSTEEPSAEEEETPKQEDPSSQETPTEQEDIVKQENIAAELLIEPLADGEIPTQQEAYSRMIAYKTVPGYKQGDPWTDDTLIPGTNSNTYTWKGGTADGLPSGGTGCAAFSFILSDAAFGNWPARKLQNGNFTFSDVKVGDILRVNNNSHSVIVLQVGDDGVLIAEGNLNKSVNWGRSMTKAEVEAATFLVTRYPKGYDFPDDPSANDPIEGGKGDLGELTWKLTNAGKLIISGKGAMLDCESLDGQPWNKFKDKILTIVIEDGVTNIGNNIFYGSNAISVTIPNSVKTIGDNAFYNSSLISVTIPSGVETIGNSAFRNCGKLISVTVPNGVKQIGDKAFVGCTQLPSIELPASIESVGAGAFFNCTELESVKFAPNDGNNIVTMGDYMFAGCHKLTSITLPSNIDSISAEMFISCISLSSISIPQGVETIGGKAFASCGQLTKVTIPDTVTQIGTGAFSNCDTLKDIYFGGSEAQWNSIRKIGDSQATLSSKTIHYNAYTLTVNYGSGSGGYSAGDTVTIVANTAPAGKVFDKWTSDNSDVKFASATSASTTFTMPAADVTITATYKDKDTSSPEKYTLTVENGTGGSSYSAGDTVTITANTAPAGKVFDKWTSDNSDVKFASATSASTIFTMPAANVTVTATYKDISVPDPSKDYTLTVENGTGGGKYNAEDTVSITANTAPTGKVFDKWTSDNSDVKFASATSASTTFIMPATDVTVTANYKDASTSDVTKPQETTKPQKVTISKTSAELKVGETLDLEAGVVPNTVLQNIVWSIDNENLAELTVDASKSTLAKITAKAEGTVIVTAKSKSYPELSAICTINIKENANLSNLAALNDAIAKISAKDYDVSGKNVNTKAKVENWVKEKIDALKLTDITIDNIDITDFTPAKSKEKGKFVFTVTLSKGEGEDKVTLTSNSLNGVITRTGSSSSGGSSGGGSSSSSSNSNKEDTNKEQNNTNENTNNENANNTNNTNDTTVNTPSKNVSVDKFVDVSNHWAADNIQFVVEKGYFAGTSENSFSPDVPMTRAMIVSVLGRVANTQGNVTTKFADVDQNQYYAPFIGWALENGITNGVSETEFNPNANVTREQLAVMFSNFIKSQGYTLNTEKEVSFTDNVNISPWAVESVEFMVKAGVLNGRTDGSFDPKGVATRAEVATILKLFLEKANV